MITCASSSASDRCHGRTTTSLRTNSMAIPRRYCRARVAQPDFVGAPCHDRDMTGTALLLLAIGLALGALVGYLLARARATGRVAALSATLEAERASTQLRARERTTLAGAHARGVRRTLLRRPAQEQHGVHRARRRAHQARHGRVVWRPAEAPASDRATRHAVERNADKRREANEGRRARTHRCLRGAPYPGRPDGQDVGASSNTKPANWSPRFVPRKLAARGASTSCARSSNSPA